MCPTCQLPIYQLRFFYQSKSFIPCHSAILASRFMASDSSSISSFASFDTETFLKQSLGAPSWQMNRDNSESGRSCVHLVCQQKNDERYVFTVPVSPCSSEVRLFPDLLHGSADLHPQIYTYQHHIPTPNKMTSERRNGHCKCFPTSIYCYQRAATFCSFQRR